MRKNSGRRERRKALGKEHIFTREGTTLHKLGGMVSYNTIGHNAVAEHEQGQQEIRKHSKSVK